MDEITPRESLLQNSAVILPGLLQVCLCSGTRREGISKVIDENKNLCRAVNRHPENRSLPPAKLFPWFADCVENNALFFDNFLAALRPTFPDAGINDEILFDIRVKAPWPGQDYSNRLIRFEVKDPDDQRACLDRVLEVCKTLLARIDENRRMLEIISEYPCIVHPGPQSWIEEFDIFFTDIGFELQWIECPGDRPRKWPLIEKCPYCGGLGIEYGYEWNQEKGDLCETKEQCIPCRGTGIFCDRDEIMFSNYPFIQNNE